MLVPADPQRPEGPKTRISKSGYLTSDAADRGRREALRAVEESKPVHESLMKFGEYATTWLSELRLANSTIQGYDKILRNHLLPSFSETKLRDISQRDIAKLYADLQLRGRRDGKDLGGPLSANTVNKVAIVLGSILQAALHDSLISINHARENPKALKAPTGRQIRAERPEIETWSQEQLDDYLRWNRSVYRDELFHMWQLISYTGMRRGEAAALQWGDVNFETATISVRRAADPAKAKAIKKTKTYTARSILLDDLTLRDLHALREVRSGLGNQFTTATAFIFGTLQNELRSPNDLSARWSRAVGKATQVLPGLPWLTIKGLRHTHATLLLEKNVSPKVVQERLGHSNIGTTMNIYSHVTPTLQREAVESLGRFAHS
jgi:integrase